MAPTADPDAVRDYYDRVDAEEYERLFDPFADDVAYERPGQAHLDGMVEFRAFYLEDRPLNEGDHEVHSLNVDGDMVAVRGTFRGVQGDDRVEFGFADFHRFDDGGKIAKRWTYTDRDTV